jgi:hypothetical protein
MHRRYLKAQEEKPEIAPEPNYPNGQTGCRILLN